MGFNLINGEGFRVGHPSPPRHDLPELGSSGLSSQPPVASVHGLALLVHSKVDRRRQVDKIIFRVIEPASIDVVNVPSERSRPMEGESDQDVTSPIVLLAIDPGIDAPVPVRQRRPEWLPG
jgi:hypothetical protein